MQAGFRSRDLMKIRLGQRQGIRKKMSYKIWILLAANLRFRAARGRIDKDEISGDCQSLVSENRRAAGACERLDWCDRRGR
jgi:hypothetical protein